MKTIDNINYEADKGKVFIRKSDNLVMGYGLGIGIKDNIDNYYEDDCPTEYKNVEGYDNTIEDDREQNETMVVPFPASDIVS